MKITAKEKTILKGMKIGTDNEMVTNPVSRVSVELCPEAVALFEIMMGSNIAMEPGKELFDAIYYTPDKREKYYAAKEVFKRNWPEEYVTLGGKI